jgi:hypothetical protein
MKERRVAARMIRLCVPIEPLTEHYETASRSVCCGHLPCQQIHQRMVSRGLVIRTHSHSSTKTQELCRRLSDVVPHEGSIDAATVSEGVRRTVDVSGLTLQ